MYSGYKPKRMSLSGIPELDGVVPTSAYKLVRGFRMEASTEDSGFMTIHDIRRITAFENYEIFYKIPIFITIFFFLEMEKLPSARKFFLGIITFRETLFPVSSFLHRTNIDSYRLRQWRISVIEDDRLNQAFVVFPVSCKGIAQLDNASI